MIWHEAYEVDIGPHVFPTAKYRLVRDRLLADGTIDPGDIFRPEPASDEAVALVHTGEYLRNIQSNQLSPWDRLRLEVPFTPALREAAWISTGGAIICARQAREQGLALHLGGGFHHAFPDHGEGFCLINDVAVAIRQLQREGAVRRAAVIDCDVHHGNGTAAIFAGDADVFTFSIHQQHNYPAHKPPSDLDLGLADGAADAEYLSALERHVPPVLATHRPELVYYLAGADPYQHDQLGGLALTRAGLEQRDSLVLEWCWAAGAPVAIALAGGYALNPDDTVAIHCATARVASRQLSSGRLAR